MQFKRASVYKSKILVLNMKLCIRKDIKRLRYVIKRLFHKEEFDFNKEDYLNYTLFHENSLFVKARTIKGLVKEHFVTNPLLKNEALFILDVGCGTGEIDRLIQGDFAKVTVIGVDSAIEAVRRATMRNLNNAKFLACSAEKFCFTDNVFDIVILANILHHSYRSILNIIQESLRVLNTSGKILIFEVNSLNPLQILWFYLFCPIDKGMHMVSPMHLRRILKNVTADNGIITIKPLPSSLYFEYMAVYSKK